VGICTAFVLSLALTLYCLAAALVPRQDKDNKDMAYRVVADHIRTLCFAIADGSR